MLRFKLLRSLFYNILWQFFNICDQKTVPSGKSLWLSFCISYFLSKMSGFLSREKLTRSKLRNFEKLPNLRNIALMQGKKDQKKEEKILHVWNELSTQDWTTLRFVLGNIWGLTLAKVFVKKFFLKFIHPNRHTHIMGIVSVCCHILSLILQPKTFI